MRSRTVKNLKIQKFKKEKSVNIRKKVLKSIRKLKNEKFWQSKAEDSKTGTMKNILLYESPPAETRLTVYRRLQ